MGKSAVTTICNSTPAAFTASAAIQTARNAWNTPSRIPLLLARVTTSALAVGETVAALKPGFVAVAAQALSNSAILAAAVTGGVAGEGFIASLMMLISDCIYCPLSIAEACERRSSVQGAEIAKADITFKLFKDTQARTDFLNEEENIAFISRFSEGSDTEENSRLLTEKMEKLGPCIERGWLLQQVDTSRLVNVLAYLGPKTSVDYWRWLEDAPGIRVCILRAALQKDKKCAKSEGRFLDSIFFNPRVTARQHLEVMVEVYLFYEAVCQAIDKEMGGEVQGAAQKKDRYKGVAFSYLAPMFARINGSDNADSRRIDFFSLWRGCELSVARGIAVLLQKEEEYLKFRECPTFADKKAPEAQKLAAINTDFPEGDFVHIEPEVSNSRGECEEDGFELVG